MKKKTILITVLIFIMALSFSVGYASNSWKNKILNNAQESMINKGKVQTEALFSSMDATLEGRMFDKVKPTLETKEQELLSEIDQYFNDKVEKILSPEEIESVENDLDIVKNNTLNTYKRQIDEFFNK